MKKRMQFSLKNEFLQLLLVVVHRWKKNVFLENFWNYKIPANSFFPTSLNFVRRLLLSLNSKHKRNNKRDSSLGEHFFLHGRQLTLSTKPI